MTEQPDRVVGLTTAAVDLIKGLIWPAVTIFVLVRFRASIGSFFAKLSEMTLKAPGFEWSAKVAQAGVAIETAKANRIEAPGEVVQVQDTLPAPAARPLTLESLATPAASAQLKGKVVLWVDDKPQNNFYEAKALRDLGIDVVQVRSTEEALAYRGPADVFITDLRRGDDDEAGIKFIRDAKTRWNKPKIIVYSSFRDKRRYQAAQEAGAVGGTYDPAGLFDQVVMALSPNA